MLPTQARFPKLQLLTHRRLIPWCNPKLPNQPDACNSKGETLERLRCKLPFVRHSRTSWEMLTGTALTIRQDSETWAWFGCRVRMGCRAVRCTWFWFYGLAIFGLGAGCSDLKKLNRTCREPKQINRSRNPDIPTLKP